MPTIQAPHESLSARFYFKRWLVSNFSTLQKIVRSQKARISFLCQVSDTSPNVLFNRPLWTWWIKRELTQNFSLPRGWRSAASWDCGSFPEHEPSKAEQPSYRRATRLLGNKFSSACVRSNQEHQKIYHLVKASKTAGSSQLEQTNKKCSCICAEIIIFRLKIKWSKWRRLRRWKKLELRLRMGGVKTSWRDPITAGYERINRERIVWSITIFKMKLSNAQSHTKSTDVLNLLEIRE